MSSWHAVANIKELVSRKKKAVDVAGTPVALFYVNEKVYALNDICIHEQRQLSKGALLFGKVICPGHQWKFDPETGQPDDQEGCQPTYAVRLDDDGQIYVSLERVKESA
jgi:anthranilate 1,2-dioxygenase ferredoxin component